MTAHEESRDWNIWWTLTAISAAATFVAGLLEALGIWHDLGLGVGFMSTALTLSFGLMGATRRALRQTTETVDRRLSQMHDTLRHIVRLLELLPDRLAERLKP